MELGTLTLQTQLHLAEEGEAQVDGNQQHHLNDVPTVVLRVIGKEGRLKAKMRKNALRTRVQRTKVDVRSSWETSTPRRVATGRATNT